MLYTCFGCDYSTFEISYEYRQINRFARNFIDYLKSSLEVTLKVTDLMSDEMQAADLLAELRLTRKHLMKGIRLAVKRLGPDAREVCIGRAVLRQIDELIAEQKIEAGFPSMAPLVRIHKNTAC